MTEYITKLLENNISDTDFINMVNQLLKSTTINKAHISQYVINITRSEMCKLQGFDKTQLMSLRTYILYCLRNLEQDKFRCALSELINHNQINYDELLDLIYIVKSNNKS